MYLIIIGAGGIGASLLELAVNSGDNVVMIEKDYNKADEISRKYDCMVLNTDASSAEILKDAGAEKADALIATTSDDATNLMLISLAKELEIPSLVSVVNNNSHAGLFRKLGANILENPEEIVSKHLYDAVKRPRIKDFINLSGDAQIFIATITEKSQMLNKTIEEYSKESDFFNDSLIIAIERDDEVIIPTGKSRVQAGDLITIFSKKYKSDTEINKLTG